jgi:hypothetical protein
VDIVLLGNELTLLIIIDMNLVFIEKRLETVKDFCFYTKTIFYWLKYVISALSPCFDIGPAWSCTFFFI